MALSLLGEVVQSLLQIVANESMMKDNHKAGGRVWHQLLSSKSHSILLSIASALLLFGGLHHITRHDLGGGIRSTDNKMMDITPSSNSDTTRLVDQIILLGERHSGTNWITDYLRECYQTDEFKVKNIYTDWKHWFQEEDLQEMVAENSALVVVMFRDPYSWVEAMRVEPHHAHSHVRWSETTEESKHLGWRERGGRPLGWHEFVTKPWIGEDNSRIIDGLGENFYELQFDGSDRAYSSIIDLRRDKIINFLSVANFMGTRALLPMRFEDLNMNGTSHLLESIEREGGLTANCSAIVGKAGRSRRQLAYKPITKHKKLPQEFIDWMNKYVDWEVENRIGYYKRSEHKGFRWG